jgi:YHS domain-containing protein
MTIFLAGTIGPSHKIGFREVIFYQILTTFLRSSGILWGLIFITVPAGAAGSDPIQQLVKSQPTDKALKFSPTFEGRGDGVHTCPVSGEVITFKNFKAEIFGRTVYFCCEGCLKSAERSPERYVKPTMAEQQQAVKAYIAKVPEAPSGAEFCNE